METGKFPLFENTWAALLLPFNAIKTFTQNERSFNYFFQCLTCKYGCKFNRSASALKMARILKGVRGFVDKCSDVVTDALFTSDVRDRNSPVLTVTFPAKCNNCNNFGRSHKLLNLCFSGYFQSNIIPLRLEVHLPIYVHICTYFYRQSVCQKVKYADVLQIKSCFIPSVSE